MTPDNGSHKIDSIIFDMDGTLWDAVDSYAVIWNVTLDRAGVPHEPVGREDLIRLMGSYLDDILEQLIPNLDKRREVLESVMINEAEMMPRLGGVLYPGVRDTIRRLAADYRLFMVSNCGASGLENFVEYNSLQPYFTDLLSHGGTGRSKADNIRALVDRYGLQRPVYVGDTQSDAESAHAAGVPIIWAEYGFGTVSNPDAVLDRFERLPEVIDSLDASTPHINS